MRSASDEIYYLFSILVAVIACAALALGVLNYRGIKEIKSKIEILERKIEDNKISIHEIQKKKREIVVSAVHTKEVKPKQHYQKKIISSKSAHKIKNNNKDKKTIIKVNSSHQDNKKRGIDAIVTDLVDAVTK